MSSTLLELGIEAMQHKDEVETVKRRVGITHEHFDCWIFNFLQNKNFDVEETVAKLERRAAMEKSELANIEVTDYMRENMGSGVIQLIGEDKEGRTTFYVVTSRDFPSAEVREERRRIFDMWLLYGTRLRKDNKRCRVTLLINQKDAGVWANTDMTFQSSVALRIAKYYPGAFDKMYVCCMGRALSAFAKPIIGRMPSAISERVSIYSEKDIANGAMLQFFDDSVLPVALGGTNRIDGPENWQRFTHTIESHFLRLRAGLRQGFGVKEWELAQLQEEEREREEEARLNQSIAGASARRGGQPMTPQQRSLGSAQGVTFDTASTTMMSCLSEDEDTGGGEGEAPTAMIDGDAIPHQARLADWDGFRVVPAPHEGSLTEALWLLEEQEAFFRRNFEELHKMQFLTFGERFVADKRRAQTVDLLGETGERIAMSCPGPARSVTRGAIWVLCVLITSYFVFATIFAQLVACGMMVLMFVGIFLEPFYVYPLGLSLLLVGYQACLIGSRGFELARATFRGTVIRPLRRFGFAGLMAQSIFFALIVVMQIAVFSVYAATTDPLTGLSISFSVGWICCACIIGLAHLGFGLGLTDTSTAPNTAGAAQQRSLAGLSLYLFLDLSEGDEESRISSRTSMTVVAGIPVTVAILFGLGFIETQHLFFLVAATVLTAVSAFFTIYFVEGSYQDHSSNLIRSSTWLLMVFWLFTIYSMGFGGWGGGSGNSVVISAVVCVCFLLITMLSVAVKSRRAHRNILRLGYGYLFLLVIVGVSIAYVVDWPLGLFATILFIHSIACFVRAGSISMVGSLTATLGGTTIFLALVLLGWVAVETDYSMPRSASAMMPPIPTTPGVSPTQSLAPGSTTASGGNDLDAIFQQQLYPLCLRRFGREPQLSVTDFALLSEIAFAKPLTRDVEMARWFPSFAYDGTVPSGGSDLVEVHRFRHEESNTTVFVLKGSQNRLLILEAMTMWVEALALTPVSLVLPANWTSDIIAVTSFVNKMLPFGWRSDLDTIARTISAYSRAVGGRAFLTGHGFGGGVAAIVGAKAHIPAVVFSAPGNVYSRSKFDVKQYDLFRFVMNVVTTNGALSSIDSHGETAQRLTCDKGVVPCQDITWMACKLLAACGDSLNRTHTMCDVILG